MTKTDTCDKSHVVVKDGCKLVRRVVYGSVKNKFIKLEGKEVPLKALKGKFRYTE